MQPVLKRLHSPDIDNLESYSPDQPDNFSFLLQAMVGSSDGEGEESFDLVVCTPQWMIERYKSDDVLLGLHKIIVLEYDYRRLRGFIEKFLMRCSGKNWDEVASKVSLLGHWEFDGHRPRPAG